MIHNTSYFRRFPCPEIQIFQFAVEALSQVRQAAPLRMIKPVFTKNVFNNVNCMII